MKIKLIAKIKDVILGYVFDTDTEITIGREIGNTIAPIIDSISRRHARIFFEGCSWKVEDLGSTNGSLINGQKITGKVALKHGDALRFGLIDMSVTLADAIVKPIATPSRPAAAPLTPQPKPMAVPPLAPVAESAPAQAALSPVSPIKPVAASPLQPVAELEPIAELEPVSPAEAAAPGSPVKPVFNVQRPTISTKLKLPPRPALKLPPRKV